VEQMLTAERNHRRRMQQLVDEGAQLSRRRHHAAAHTPARCDGRSCLKVGVALLLREREELRDHVDRDAEVDHVVSRRHALAVGIHVAERPDDADGGLVVQPCSRHLHRRTIALNHPRRAVGTLQRVVDAGATDVVDEHQHERQHVALPPVVRARRTVERTPPLQPSCHSRQPCGILCVQPAQLPSNCPNYEAALPPREDGRLALPELDTLVDAVPVVMYESRHPRVGALLPCLAEVRFQIEAPHRDSHAR
jgi:hypothetical protein